MCALYKSKTIAVIRFFFFKYPMAPFPIHLCSLRYFDGIAGNGLNGFVYSKDIHKEIRFVGSVIRRIMPVFTKGQLVKLSAICKKSLIRKWPGKHTTAEIHFLDRTDGTMLRVLLPRTEAVWLPCLPTPRQPKHPFRPHWRAASMPLIGCVQTASSRTCTNAPVVFSQVRSFHYVCLFPSIL